MKRKKIIILGTLATIPIIVTSVSCGEANTNVNEIKVAIAKQYVSDYYKHSHENNTWCTKCINKAKESPI